MRIVCVALAMIVMTGASSAQPSLSPPSMTSPVDRVSDDDDVTEIQRIMGPTVAFTVGFGLGHVVEGRWLEKGWIFTAGETAGVALWMGGYMMDMSCDKHCELVGPMIITGMIGTLALRIWESVDAVNGARLKHARYLDRRARYGLHLAPAKGGGGGAVAGLSLRF